MNMNLWVQLGIGIAVFYVGGFLGFWLRGWLWSRHEFDGVIKVLRDEDRLIYSLELHEDPAMLEHMNEVVFKVSPLMESSDRN